MMPTIKKRNTRMNPRKPKKLASGSPALGQDVETNGGSPTSIVTVPLTEDRTPFADIANISDTNVRNVGITPTKFVLFDSPSKFDQTLPMRALLDSEVTPSPQSLKMSSPNTARLSIDSDSTSASTPRRLPFCGMMQGSCCESLVFNSCTQSQAHFQISSVLSAEENESSWQAWSLGAVVDSYNKPTTADPSSSKTDNREVKANLNRVLQNRAFHMTARKNRLSSLKENMHFERASTSNLFKTRSFSMTRLGKVSPQKKKTGSFFWNFGNCGDNSVIHEDDDDSFRVPVDDSYCYDSDPEEFLRRPFKSMVVRKSDDDKENIPPSLSEKLGNEEEVKQHVQNFMNEKWTILRHNPECRSSRAVHVWTERGHRLSDQVIAPKLRWDTVNGKKKNGQGASGINILDVHRILTPTIVNREMYPFAKLGLLVMVKTLDESILFEFKNQQEHKRFLNGFKLLVARLGSMLVVGDSDMAEFFNIEQEGPGEVPYWLEV